MIDTVISLGGAYLVFGLAVLLFAQFNQKYQQDIRLGITDRKRYNATVVLLWPFYLAFLCSR